MTGNKMNLKKIEKIVKGFSNHRRIEIMELLSKEPELSLNQIAAQLKINFKTASEHVRRLAFAELVVKRYQGASVCHKLTNRGVNILKFLRILE